jgi:hypothetical protein
MQFSYKVVLKKTFKNLKGIIMKKISARKVQKLKTTAVALYPIWMCWPFPL